jgi:hypothetical protein
MNETKSFDAATWGPILVSVLVMGNFLAAISIAWWTKDTSLQVLLGMAGTNAGTAVGYWLGSSSGSKSKDATIASQASTTTTVAPMATITTTTGAG